MDPGHTKFQSVVSGTGSSKLLPYLDVSLEVSERLVKWVISPTYKWGIWG